MLLSLNIRNVLANRPVDYFHCIKIIRPNNTIWKSITTLWHELTIDGVEYTPNSIVAVDSPKMNTTVDREQFKFMLADPGLYDAATIENNLMGYTVEIRLCFLHYQTKLPLTDLADTILIYRGRVDAVSYAIKTEEKGEIYIQIVCASPMSDLDLKKYIYLSKDSIRSRNPEDTCCDSIYGGSGQLLLKWGKK